MYSKHKLVYVTRNTSAILLFRSVTRINHYRAASVLVACESYFLNYALRVLYFLMQFLN